MSKSPKADINNNDYVPPLKSSLVSQLAQNIDPNYVGSTIKFSVYVVSDMIGKHNMTLDLELPDQTTLDQVKSIIRDLIFQNTGIDIPESFQMAKISHNFLPLE